MRRAKEFRGVTLIEVVAAVTIAATVIALSMHYLRLPAATGKQRGCDLTRQMLQNDVQRYNDSTGKMPRGNLRELRNEEYAGSVLPKCPATGEAYQLDRSGTVECPTHESTRVK